MADKKQTAVVTGASSGIGRETAIGLAGKGFQVIAAARRMDRLKELAIQIKGITPRQVDLSQPEETEYFCRYLTLPTTCFCPHKQCRVYHTGRVRGCIHGGHQAPI